MHTVFIGVNDIGGANAVLPVASFLARDADLSWDADLPRDVDLFVYAGGPAKEACKNNGISFADADDMDENHLLEAYREHRPVLSLLGTSPWFALEKKMAYASRNAGVRLISILDYWCSYEERFTDNQGEMSLLPDILCVMDSFAYDEIKQNGKIPMDIVRITGNPFFDGLAEECMTKRILYASQPIGDLYGDRLGYTELTVLEDMIEAVSNIASADGFPAVICIRRHPREDAGKYSGFLKNSNVTVRFDDIQNSRDSIRCSDIVAGINSMLLFESAMLGKPTISYQPGITGNDFKDFLVSNRMGISRLAGNKAELADAILASGMKRDLPGYLMKDATRKVADIVYGMLRAEGGA